MNHSIAISTRADAGIRLLRIFAASPNMQKPKSPCITRLGNGITENHYSLVTKVTGVQRYLSIRRTMR